MKKRIILIIAAWFVLAPRAYAEEVKAGLKTGLNVTTFIGSDASPGDVGKVQKSGLVAGGYVIIPVNKQVKVQAECLVSVKGAIYKWEVLDTVYEEILNLTYLEIPVLARFDIETRSAAKPAILIGPAFGIKISARGEYRSIGASSSGDLDHIKTFDPGLVLGGVVDIVSGKGKVSLEARYTMGLATISESSGGSTPDIRNSAASVIFGYQF
ncbi:MAG: hypothetical protein COX65_03520 [Elusimicrobia bacterium CG_4_10_14_0_2_um_filter_56_8]|nr:MAG: hypothetical protein AUJ51_01990 [Elusimicrobia bacterium CG1_02_56_21]PJA15992.1 MAG: hypothetical protein COX65_03520 [Elusimicrobia bacterium CG_4_10_14_0_2_um_filter_56_8]